MIVLQTMKTQAKAKDHARYSDGINKDSQNVENRKSYSKKLNYSEIEQRDQTLHYLRTRNPTHLITT